MPKLTLIEHNGTQHTIECDIGQTVMQAATSNLVPGIVADCGGCCSCATCHVYVEDSWIERVAPAREDEMNMLECVLEPQASSRLCCQLTMEPALDGLIVRLPASQY
jgi:2Fe-2S ferredoxin